MKKFFSIFFFSLIVAVAMNGLDMAYHLATSWVVHFGYVLVKLTVIFLSIFLVSKFIGIGKEEGIFVSILGPFMFWLYYVAANPTLNRAVFKIDEQFWFMFLHILFLLIAYFSSYYILKHKKDWMKKTSFVVLFSFSAIAFNALYFMIIWSLNGIDEETAASLFTFSMIPLPFISYALVSVLHSYKKKIFNPLVSGITASLIVLLFSRNIFDAMAVFIIANLVFYLIYHYDLKNNVINLFSRKGWIILAAVTGLIGSFYHFVPRKTIKEISEFLIFNTTVLSYRIRQNDLVMFSTILLIISLVSLYKVYKLSIVSKKK